MHSLIIITIAAIVLVVAAVALSISWRFRHVFCVPEGSAGLLYHHGLYVRRNNAGRHVLWGRGWTIHLVDLRKALLAVSSEDFILADKTRLRISPHISYQITDPVKAAHETQHWPHELDHAALRALHSQLSGFSFEELLAQRPKIAAQLLAHTQPEAAKIGINLLAIDFRYYIPVAE